MRYYSREIIAAALLLLVTAAAFWYVRGCEYINYDDPDYVGNASPIAKGLRRDNIAWAFTTTHAANWHPLTWLSLELDAEIYKRMLGAARAGGYHLNNLLLHLASTVVLFGVLRRMTGQVWPSALVAALFGVHPLHVESVAWISERKDVLSTLFWMLTLWFYTAYVERPRWWRYLLVVVALTLGLLSKPMLVTLPCVLLLLDYWPLQRGKIENSKLGELRRSSIFNFQFSISNFQLLSRLLLEKLPLFALAAASCVVTWYAQHRSGAVQSFERFGFGVRMANAVAAYAGYIRKTFWPTDLALFYPHPGPSLPWQHVVLSVLLLVLVTGLVLWQARRRPYLVVGWFWYLGTLVPVIGLVQVGAQAMADRYTYVPHIGLFIMFAWGLADLVTWRPALRGIAALGSCALVIVCGVMTHVQTWHWHDSVPLWQHVLKVTTDNYQAHYLLGLALVEQKRPADATEHFVRAAELRPNDATYQLNVGMFLEQQWGRLDDALRCFTAAVQLQPDSPAANYNLGRLREKLGQLDEAEKHFHKALEAQAEYPDVHKHLGQVLIKQGKPAEAVAWFRRALDLRPDDVVLQVSLADALQEAGQRDEAAALFAAARRAEPDAPQKARKTAWMLATNKDPGKHDPWEAVRLARLANHATGSHDPVYLDTLAAAHAAVGDFPRAEQTARDALALANGNRELTEAITGRLRLYEKKVAFEQGN
jgi:tetratricopeptide (TPR) repeat protein